ncbi:MAG: hypothetical protein HC848_02755 [Limnobacter sp.]|nr:hypothetical protein [Limnobacter sp.]
MRNPLRLPLTLSGWVSLAKLALYTCTVGLAVWFILKLSEPAPTVAPAMQNAPSAQFRMDQSAEARLLGVETEGGLTPPSLQLLGVFASSSGKGAAILSVEGQPAESMPVGSMVANGWQLDEVGNNFAVISRSGQQHRIELPTEQPDPDLLQRVPGG